MYLNTEELVEHFGCAIALKIWKTHGTGDFSVDGFSVKSHPNEWDWGEIEKESGIYSDEPIVWFVSWEEK
jgi:hypothetical protein